MLRKAHTAGAVPAHTRVCHGCASVALLRPLRSGRRRGSGAIRAAWVIFPACLTQNHLMIEGQESEDRRRVLRPSLQRNFPVRRVPAGVAAGGVSREYALETLTLRRLRFFKVATPHPFPEKLALEFLKGLDECSVLEELDPVIERALLQLAASTT
jgi:indolepyruvate ferredoxin oxidoreductase alpha subunit